MAGAAHLDGDGFDRASAEAGITQSDGTGRSLHALDDLIRRIAKLDTVVERATLERDGLEGAGKFPSGIADNWGDGVRAPTAAHADLAPRADGALGVTENLSELGHVEADHGVGCVDEDVDGFLSDADFKGRPVEALGEGIALFLSEGSGVGGDADFSCDELACHVGGEGEIGVSAPINPFELSGRLCEVRSQ